MLRRAMAKQIVTGPCKLCGMDSRLLESHILPSFVFRWLKSRSGASGHIRMTDNPNLRVQDGLKEHWLCLACEGLIGRDETVFANQVFHPYTKGIVPIKYGPELLRFCTSISWRVLHFACGFSGKASYSAQQIDLVARAEKRWRNFLLSSTPHPGVHEQHLLMFGAISSATVDDFPSNINRFLTGPVTLDIVGSSSSLMTFAKLGPLMIFGHIQANSREWEGSKVRVKGGVLPSKKYVLPGGLLPLIKEGRPR